MPGRVSETCRRPAARAASTGSSPLETISSICFAVTAIALWLYPPGACLAPRVHDEGRDPPREAPDPADAGEAPAGTAPRRRLAVRAEVGRVPGHRVPRREGRL